MQKITRKALQEINAQFPQGISNAFIGPVKRDDRSGLWYFLSLYGVDADPTDAGHKMTRIEGARQDVTEHRAAFIAALAADGKPKLVVPLDSELELARFMKIMWPTPENKAIFARVQAQHDE